MGEENGGHPSNVCSSHRRAFSPQSHGLLLASWSFKSERMGQDKGPGDRKFLGERTDGGEVDGGGEGSQDVPRVCAPAHRVRRGRPPRPHWAGSAAGGYSPGGPGSPALWAPSPGEAVELDSLGWVGDCSIVASCRGMR